MDKKNEIETIWQEFDALCALMAHELQITGAPRSKIIRRHAEDFCRLSEKFEPKVIAEVFDRNGIRMKSGDRMTDDNIRRSIRNALNKRQ